MEEQRNIAFETINETLSFLEKETWKYASRKSDYAYEYTKAEREQAKAIYEYIQVIHNFITDTYLKKAKEL